MSLIRPAQSHEHERLSTIARRSKAYWGYSPGFMAACQAELTYTAAEIDKGHFFVALERKNPEIIVGFSAITPLNSHQFELEAMFVEPQYMGQGYGRSLLEHAKQTVKRLAATALIIQADPHAVPFYRRMGGQRVGERESESIPGRFLPILSIQLPARHS
ncbi:MAG: GNAT family N-acetyltransferase [Cyanobacteria bacterium P01_G01_bin.54]